MPVLMIFLLMWLSPFIASGAAVDITLNLNAKEAAMIQFYATQQGRTPDQVLRHMCNVGMASFQSEYLKILDEGRAGVMRQLSPEERTTVCGIFAGKGAPCPDEEP